MQESASFGFDNEVAKESDIVELRRLTEELWRRRAAYEEAKTRASALNAEVEEAERAILRMMELTGLERFDGPDCTVLMREKRNVKVPRDPESRRALFEYFKASGIFDDMITVNANTLNSWWRNETEVRQANGITENIPGIEEVTTYYDLMVRKR